MGNKYTTERHVTGGGALVAALDRLGLAARTAAITEGVTAALHPISAAMRTLAPVKTGEYRASIAEKVVSYPANAKAVGLVGPTGRARNKAHLLEYGHLVTNSKSGHTIRNQKARDASTGRTHVAARPHIRPAVLTTHSQQAAAFRDGCARGLAAAR